MRSSQIKKTAWKYHVSQAAILKSSVAAISFFRCLNLKKKQRVTQRESSCGLIQLFGSALPSEEDLKREEYVNFYQTPGLENSL